MVWPFSNKPDYEQKVTTLTAKIRHCQLILTKYQNSHRRAKGLVTFYSILIYIIYVTMVVAANSLRKPRNTLLVTVSPGLIVACRKLISLLFNWLISRKETQLDALNDQRNALIEEYKEKTDYYKIKKVVDEAESNSEVHHHEDIVEHVPEPIAAPQVPVSESEPYQTPAPPAPPAQPTWMDRVMDMVLGENEQSPNNRYALICGRCHHHNGLATYGQVPEQVVYVCPFCGFVNGQSEPRRESSVHADKIADLSEKESVKRRGDNRPESEE